MGETADQTRDEIVRLRQDMSQKIVALRKASERPLRIARMAALGTVVVVVVGGTALIVLRARRRAEARSLKGRARAVAHAVADPGKAVKQTRKGVEKAAEDTREKLRAEIRKELQDQVKDVRPLPEKIFSGVANAAVSAAIPIVMRKIQERVDPDMVPAAGARK
ncbi:MAG: hypothetical protein ABR573_01585 [Candidatus Dormibacteria bacterium]